MAFSPQFLDEIRSRVSLAGVVGRHVRLVKRGREYVGLCPFHKEKTPSFNVVEEKGFYHCFGCGAHGDVIGFSMRASNLSFREAVEALAKQAGIAIPDDTPHERERAARIATLADACEAACQFFQTQLAGHKGSRAMDYLRGRGITQEQIHDFRLGYAPSGVGLLLQELSPHFPEPLLIEAGLVRRGEGGRAFEFFRDRVIFPIMDRQGRVIAFGGRTMGDGQPKYLNSPDSPVFQKGSNLFAFHLARKEIKADVPPIVAEGYMDVIALHGAGFRTAVAPLGTALTEQQLAELWKISNEPVLCFDGDPAGRRAAGRALERALPLLRPGLSLRFVTLPPGDDPDSLIQAQGAPAFRRYLGSSEELSEYLWASATRGRKFTTPERLSKLEHDLREKVLLIENRQVQRLYGRFFYDRIVDLSWENRQRQRKKEGVDKLEYGEKVRQWLSEDAIKAKIQMMMIALGINHPQLVQNDIDQFAAVHPTRRELRELHEKVMEFVGTDLEWEDDKLRQRLEEVGLRGSVNKLFSSSLYRSGKFAHPNADPEQVATAWRALFSRYLLPDVKKQLDEAQARLATETNDENWQTVMMYRQLFEEQNTEAGLIRERWDSVERVGTWRPGTQPNSRDLELRQADPPA